MPGIVTKRKTLVIGLGALVAPVLLAGSAGAASGDHSKIAPIPPVAPVDSVLLARGAAGEFHIANPDTGVTLRATESTDVVMVKTTVQPHSSTGWHTHAGPSVVIVASGAVRLIEPEDGDDCAQETFSAGASFVHPADVHDVANDGAEAAVVYATYFVPEGASPALVPVDRPRGC